MTSSDGSKGDVDRKAQWVWIPPYSMETLKQVTNSPGLGTLPSEQEWQKSAYVDAAVRVVWKIHVVKHGQCLAPD
jgi:hypothetical protein